MAIQPYEHGHLPMIGMPPIRSYVDMETGKMFLVDLDGISSERSPMFWIFHLGLGPEKKQNYMPGWCSGEADFY